LPNCINPQAVSTGTPTVSQAVGGILRHLSADLSGQSATRHPIRSAVSRGAQVHGLDFQQIHCTLGEVGH
jgi:hypothetical protein